MDATDHLFRVPLFQELEPEAVKKLGVLTRRASFPAGATIVEIGESGLSLFVIIEGHVRVLYPARSSNSELKVTMSGGYACCPDDTASSEALFSMADKALFRAKAEGRNRVCQPKTD